MPDALSNRVYVIIKTSCPKCMVNMQRGSVCMAMLLRCEC